MTKWGESVSPFTMASTSVSEESCVDDLVPMPGGALKPRPPTGPSCARAPSSARRAQALHFQGNRPALCCDSPSQVTEPVAFGADNAGYPCDASKDRCMSIRGAGFAVSCVAERDTLGRDTLASTAPGSSWLRQDTASSSSSRPTGDRQTLPESDRFSSGTGFVQLPQLLRGGAVLETEEDEEVEPSALGVHSELASLPRTALRRPRVPPSIRGPPPACLTASALRRAWPESAQRTIDASSACKDDYPELLDEAMPDLLQEGLPQCKSLKNSLPTSLVAFKSLDRGLAQPQRKPPEHPQNDDTTASKLSMSPPLRLASPELEDPDFPRRHRVQESKSYAGADCSLSCPSKACASECETRASLSDDLFSNVGGVVDSTSALAGHAGIALRGRCRHRRRSPSLSCALTNDFEANFGGAFDGNFKGDLGFDFDFDSSFNLSG